MKQKKYQSDPFDRQIQRHVHPLWIKDELGNLNYSGTIVFVKYQNHHFLITAAHVIPDGVKIEDLFFLTSKVFLCLNKFGHVIHCDDEIDLAIMKTNVIWDDKNYFDLSYSLSLISAPYINPNIEYINLKEINWIGFPKGKSKNNHIHKSKFNEKGLLEISAVDEKNHPEQYVIKQKYLILKTKIKDINTESISLYINPKEMILYKYSLKKSKTPCLIGMSGGALFYMPNNITDEYDFTKTLVLAGIGTQYNNADTITGISIYLLVECIKSIIDQYEIGFYPEDIYL